MPTLYDMTSTMRDVKDLKKYIVDLIPEDHPSGSSHTFKFEGFTAFCRGMIALGFDAESINGMTGDFARDGQSIRHRVEITQEAIEAFQRLE